MNDFVLGNLTNLTSPAYNTYQRFLIHNVANMHGLGHYLVRSDQPHTRKHMIVKKKGDQTPMLHNLQVFMLHHNIYSDFRPISIRVKTSQNN